MSRSRVYLFGINLATSFDTEILPLSVLSALRIQISILFSADKSLYPALANACSNTRKIATTILSTAIHRGTEKSTCPSEIARKLFPDDWRKHMKDVLAVAIDLHNQGSIAITQKGIPVDVEDIKGPVRIKMLGT